MIKENDIKLAGNLTADPELNYTGSGKAICKFSIGISRSWKDKSGDWQKETSYFRVTAFGYCAEKVAESRNGDAVYIKGYLKQERWEASDGTKRSMVVVMANSIQTEPKASHTEHSETPPTTTGIDDDIPF